MFEKWIGVLFVCMLFECEGVRRKVKEKEKREKRKGKKRRERGKRREEEIESEG